LWATMASILWELANTIYVSEVNARAMMDSPVFQYTWQMLGSPDPVARSSSCNLLGSLAWYECSIPLILEMRGCGRLLSLL
jgi:hypothetical protein